MFDPREIHAAAQDYLAKGWPLISIPPVDGKPTKAPLEKGWPEHLLQDGDVLGLRPLSNLGLLLADLTDIDLDCREAREAGKVFLPPTGLIYGRASSPGSHYLYRTKEKLPYHKFILPEGGDRGALLEYRSMLSANGTPPKALQSLVPPSIHPSGEKYEWAEYAEPGEVAGAALWRAVHMVAVTAALARLHPGLDDLHKTARDEYRLTVSGVLARHLSADDAIKVFTSALRIAGDSKDRRTILETTVTKLHAGDTRVKGIPSFIGLIGRKQADAVLSWLNEIAEKKQNATLSSPFNGQVATLTPAFEDEEEPTETKILACPTAALEGDLIGELTHALADGTFVPPIYIREDIKAGLGAIVNGKVGLRFHPNIHTRVFHLKISDDPQAGKAESWLRTWSRERGFLYNFLSDAGELGAGLVLGAGVTILGGGLFGSGEFMASLLAREENRRSIAYFDEMCETFEKANSTGSTIEAKLLQLFDGGEIQQGSFKNKEHIAQNVELSVVGNFTRPGFDKSFTGRGSRGSGFLSRCVYSYADKTPGVGDWPEIDTDLVNRLCAQIAACLARIRFTHSGDRIILEETPDATKLRRDVAKWIETLDHRYTARLADHMKRDLLLRALFSEDPVITAEMVARSRDWVQYQYGARFLLWPEDAGSNVERMEAIVLSTLEKSDKPLSDNRLAQACHASRPGSGGYSALHYAITALARMNQIRAVGKTRKGRLVYERIS